MTNKTDSISEISLNHIEMEEAVIDPIPEDVKQRIIRKALISRKLEERLLDLFSQGKLFGTVHTCIGQEFSGAVVTEFLQNGDSIFSNHRCHGHFISFTNDVQGLMAEIMGKKSGVCGGRGGSQHLCKNGFYSNGVQGGIVPVATGLAFAKKIHNKQNISVVFIGDGTLGEGAVYESFNIASKWNLPLLVVLENNGYAQSTNQQETLAGDICQRAAAFGICTAKGNTWDWEKLYFTAQNIINYVRKESKPAFLQIDTFRLKAHSKGDDNRPRSEIEPFEQRDPINIIIREKNTKLLALLEEANQVVEDAVAAAESAPYPSFEKFSDSRKVYEWVEVKVTKRRVSKALNETFKEMMRKHPKMMFIGEDVRSPYGGAFKVAADLSDMFPDRVLNTPISESAIVGIGSGLAMEEFYPFVEIMFGDFMSLTFDQILNNASKFRYMYNNQVKTNLVIRTPMGGGRGYGPTHSQTLDRHFLGIPGLRVIAINNLIEPQIIYEALMDSCGDPTLVIENKLLYSLNLREQLPEGFKTFISKEQFPTIWVKPESDKVDITIIGYGGLSDTLVNVADKIFEEYEIVSQIICPTQLYPFSIKPLLSLMSRSHFILIVEEGQGFAGFSAEVIAQIAEQDVSLLKKVKRIGPPASSIPASGLLEKAMLPNEDNIIQGIVELINEN